MQQIVTPEAPEAWPWWLPTPEALAERERLLKGKYFLVKISGNGGVGETWRCRNCGGKHRYLTLMCVEQPFSGISGGLYAYYHTIGATGSAGFLPPAERARLEAVARRINPGRPDLSTSHPAMARAIGTGERDADLGALALGVLEQIPVSLARRLAERIRARGAAFSLPGPAGREG